MIQVVIANIYTTTQLKCFYVKSNFCWNVQNSFGKIRAVRLSVNQYLIALNKDAIVTFCFNPTSHGGGADSAPPSGNRLVLLNQCFWKSRNLLTFHICSIREGFNKKKTLKVMEFSILGGGVYPISITFFGEKKCFFHKKYKDDQDGLIHPQSKGFNFSLLGGSG